jgi:hypothetical protein
MISKSTKKKRRKMRAVNVLRNRLSIYRVANTTDVWVINIQHTKTDYLRHEVRGLTKAMKHMRRIFSNYAKHRKE